MANAATINLLVRRVRQRADQIGSATFDDATELKLWIRGALSQLYEILADRWNDFYVVNRPMSLAANAMSYALPADFRAMHDVFVIGGGGSARSRLTQFAPEELARPPGYAAYPTPTGFRVMRDMLYILPTPQADAVNALEIWYTPEYRAPLLDYTPISDVLPNGWEEWVVLDMLLKMSHKTRLLNVEALERERAKVEARLIGHASVRVSDAAMMRDIFRTVSPLAGSTTEDDSSLSTRSRCRPLGVPVS